MTQFQIELAGAKDDIGLRKILCETPMDGEISLSLEREPDYFIAAAVEAPEHQIIIGRNTENDEIMGMGGRALRQLYLNGQVKTIGYLSQFRILPKYRGLIKILLKSWQKLRELHQDQKSPFYYTSIIEDNHVARRFLTRQLPGLPQYIEYTRMHTLAIFSKRQKKALNPPAEIRILRGEEKYTEQIISCLQRNLQRFQLAPHWTSDLLFTKKHTPNLNPQDFFIALQGDQVTGCLALWDQNGFKQTVVRGYSGKTKRWRWLLNLLARLFGYPALPDENEKINYAYASHLAVDEDNPQIYQALLRGLHHRAVAEGFSYFLLGLSENHPLRQLTQDQYRHIDYTSIIYWVTWDEHLPEIEERIAAPEIAIF